VSEQRRGSTHSAGPLSDSSLESQARKKVRPLWQRGDLFHNCTRYPRNAKAKKIDRLAGILKNGLVAPGGCRDGSVFSDLNLTVTGCDVPYDSLVFLHRFGDVSYIYTICDPGRFAVFVDPTHPVLTPEDMGENWALLCQDEVYVRDRVALEKLTGIAVHPEDAEGVMEQFLADFRRLGIPLYGWDGTVLWPKQENREPAGARYP